MLLLHLMGTQGAQAAEGATFWLPPQASTYAADTDFVFYFIYYTCVVFFLIMMGAVAYFVWAHRQKGPDDTVPDIKGSHALEIGWSVVPGIFMVAMFWFGFTIWIDQAVPPAESMEIRVNAQKWQWSYTYRHKGKSVLIGGPDAECMKRVGDPTRDVECNAPLRVPVGQPIKLIMSSSDVLHSFYVPDFRTKKDIVPGRYTVAWFEALDVGEHNLFCTEYCGDRHGYMYSKVIVMPEKDFNIWLDEEAANVVEGPLPGDKLFAVKGCAGCHSVDGSKMIGPSLKGVYGKMETLEGGEQVSVDDNYIRESILVPAAKIVAGYPPTMPSFQGQLSDAEVANLIDYIKTLAE